MPRMKLGRERTGCARMAKKRRLGLPPRGGRVCAGLLRDGHLSGCAALKVADNNHPSMRLYARLGFVSAVHS